MTVSPGLSSAVGCSSSAMRASAARGSPWLPVASARTLLRGRRSNASMPRNGGTPSSMPNSRATATTRSIARPRMQTCRPAANPASAAERRRATLEAKVVTTTLPFALADQIARASRRRRARTGFRPRAARWSKSQTSASTPSSPSAVRRASSVGRPRTGVGVDLPVAGMDDEAGRRADRERRALRDRMGDGNEFDVERADLEPRARLDDPDRNLRRARLAEPARFGEAGGEGRRIDLDAEARPQLGQRADMVLVRMGDDDADEILLHLLDEADVGHDEIDARQVVAGEGDAEVDHQPLARLRRAIAVERAIHSDFAQAPERREHELAVVCHSVPAFPRKRSGRSRHGRAIRLWQYPEIRGFDRFDPAPLAKQQTADAVKPLERPLSPTRRRFRC